MELRLTRARGVLAAALLSLAGTAAAHSWPERTMRIAPNGTMVGEPGFERAHIVRGSGIAEDDIVWLLPPNGREKVILPDDKIARPGQRALNADSYTEQFPMLRVAPGDFVAIQYTENGHVSRPELSNPTKPVNRGTVYLYGTTENDLTNANLVDIHLAWTADGKGGDGKGRLLATRNYDDGQCHEAIPADGDGEGITSHRMDLLKQMSDDPMNGGLMCQSDLQIPADVAAGEILTVIWVWDWPTMNVQGVAVPPASYHANSSDSDTPYVSVPELYTGVVDFQVVDPCDDSLGPVKGPSCRSKKGGHRKQNVKFAKQKSPSVAAIRSHMLKPFLVDVPQAGSGATAATAHPTDIPVAGLIGIEDPQLPLPPSFFQPGHRGSDGPGDSGDSGDSDDSDDSGDSAPTPTSTSAPVSATLLPSGGERFVTVTVTVPATTIYVTTQYSTTTTTSSIPLGTGAAFSGTTTASPVVVTPFMTRPRTPRVRRAAGGWKFGPW